VKGKIEMEKITGIPNGEVYVMKGDLYKT